MFRGYQLKKHPVSTHTMHMPSFQMHCNCKVASPTCFCIANQFHKLCTERNTSTCNLICGPIVFSKPVFSPGSRPSPLYCLTHPNKNYLWERWLYVFVLSIWIGISKSQIRYFWALDKVRKSGNWEDAADGHGFPRIYKFSFNLNGLFYFSGWQFF